MTDVENNILTLGNYNITATFFSDPNPTDEKDPKRNTPQHHWINRKKYFHKVLQMANCDVLGLQELSPEQAVDFLTMFPKHKFYFFALAQTKEVDAGTVCTNLDEVKQKFLGKFIGTALIGIMYNPVTVSVTSKDVGVFWYNPEPFKKPTAVDRSETDKGFGNMNTPRGPGYVKFTHNFTNKDFYFFTSHAPISGGAKTRTECFKLENRVIKELTGDGVTVPFFSIADRNMFSDDNFDESYSALVPHGVYDWVDLSNPDNHVGFPTTWLGYLYEPVQCQNKVLANMTFEKKYRLDIGISSLKSISSAHYHCIIRDDETQLLGDLVEADNETRNFLSDHSMVVAKFSL
jgi:hypothetical protein